LIDFAASTQTEAYASVMTEMLSPEWFLMAKFRPCVPNVSPGVALPRRHEALHRASGKLAIRAVAERCHQCTGCGGVIEVAEGLLQL
jgi:hypothetical protein